MVANEARGKVFLYRKAIEMFAVAGLARAKSQSLSRLRSISFLSTARSQRRTSPVMTCKPNIREGRLANYGLSLMTPNDARAHNLPLN